jgi:hypothetical protein
MDVVISWYNLDLRDGTSHSIRNAIQPLPCFAVLFRPSAVSNVTRHHNSSRLSGRQTLYNTT